MSFFNNFRDYIRTQRDTNNNNNNKNKQNRTVEIAWKKKTKNIFKTLFCCCVQSLLFVTRVIGVNKAGRTTRYRAIEMPNINYVK